MEHHLTATECHVGSHSVTCHPTQANTPRLHPSQSGWYSIYLPRRDGRLRWPRWLVTYRDGLPGTSTQCKRYKCKSRAITGRTARCRCKFRYLSNFTTASCGLPAIARLSCSFLSADNANLHSEVSEEAATEIAKKCRRRQPHCHLTPLPEEPPSISLYF